MPARTPPLLGQRRLRGNGHQITGVCGGCDTNDDNAHAAARIASVRVPGTNAIARDTVPTIRAVASWSVTSRLVGAVG